MSTCARRGAPLGEHLLRGLGQHTLGVTEDRLGAVGDGGVDGGGGGGGAPEWHGRLGAGVLRLGDGCTPHLARPAAERRRRRASE